MGGFSGSQLGDFMFILREEVPPQFHGVLVAERTVSKLDNGFDIPWTQTAIVRMAAERPKTFARLWGGQFREFILWAYPELRGVID